MCLTDLSNTVYKTMSARFTAYRRMKRNRDASKVAEAMLSASIIGISLIALQCKNLEQANHMSAATIILSTFLLVLSLLFQGLGYEKRMENYHSCGNELNRLYRLMKHDEKMLSEEEQKKKELEYLQQYEDLLVKYNLNHTSFDYCYSLTLMADEEVGSFSRFCLKLRYYVFDAYMLYWLIAIVPVMWIAWYFICL